MIFVCYVLREMTSIRRGKQKGERSSGSIPDNLIILLLIKASELNSGGRLRLKVVTLEIRFPIILIADCTDERNDKRDNGPFFLFFLLFLFIVIFSEYTFYTFFI